MNTRPKILLTNDDGIHSPGLRAAVQAVIGLGQILVVAPSTQQTAMGRSFTGDPDAMLAPLDYRIDGCRIDAFHCACSPALAVSHGLLVLCQQQKPDLIISGINYGENVGINITISGTVGAACEGACLGIPALAVSLQTDSSSYFHHTEQDWQAAGHFLRMFANLLLTQALPMGVDVLKVDIPASATVNTPWRLTRLSRHIHVTPVIESPSLESRLKDTTFLITPDPTSLEPDSDIYALLVDQVVAVTPLSLDLTSRTDFDVIARNLRATPDIRGKRG